jgi:hypothetical protein
MKRILVCSVLMGLLAACSAKVDEDGAEVKVNSGTKDSISENLDKAGDELEKGADKAKAKLENAGEAIKEGFNETKDRLTDDNDASVKVEVKKD